MTIKNQDDVRLLKSNKEVWSDVLALLAKRVSPGSIQFLNNSQLTAVNDKEVVIAVYNGFTRTMALKESKTVCDAVFEVTNLQPLVLKVDIDDSLKPQKYTPTIASISFVENGGAEFSANPHPHHRPGSPLASLSARSDLSPKYTFDTFVVGSHNRFVHSAALNVAGKPGSSYNPLFIYGGVGLGKTHIMQSIGHEILKHSPQMSVRYMSCERFINDFINCVRDKSMSEFRKRYRLVDVLLIDDIQFLEGKESSQEEFFHTFNALRESGRQLVLSSDRPPKAIAAIEERMRSRLEQGLVADIQAPDLETRVAILRKKRDLESMQVQDDALEYIASLYTTNIRELEGALIRTHAYASMGGSELTPAMLRSILNPGAPAKQKKNLTIDQIINVVSAHYRVEPSEVRSSKRTKDLTVPRHVAMYLAHEIMQMSLPRIGEAFSNRKHTSALYAYDKVKELLATDADLAYAVKQLTSQLAD